MKNFVRNQARFVATALTFVMAGCGAGMNNSDAASGDDSAMMGADSNVVADGAVANDAATMSGDADPTPVPGPEVQIRIAANCPTFTPCGGDPAGAWQYTGVCVSDLLPELAASCPGMTVEGTGTARGGVTFSGGVVRRNVSTRFNVTANLPAACTFGMCGAAQSSLRSAGFADASCAANAGGCRCTFTATGNVNDGDPYTVQGTQIVVGTNRYDFCVSGGTMRYRQVGAQPAERGVADLARR